MGQLCAQPLSGLEDLLADDPRVGCALAKALEVLQRIAKAVGVIDAHAVEHAVFEPLEDERVGLFEDVLALDTKTDERVDVEEAAIAELLIGGLPVGDAEVLLLEEFVERVDVLVELADGAINALADTLLLEKTRRADCAERSCRDGARERCGGPRTRRQEDGRSWRRGS